MARIIADIDIPYLKGLLEPYASVEYLPYTEISKERISGYDGLIVRTRTACDALLLDGTGIRAIATASAGDDHINKQYFSENEIQWAASHGCNADAVAEYVVVALHHLASEKSFKLKDSTLGIIGVGNVGSRLARMATKLGMNVLLCDPPRQREESNTEFKSLAETLSGSDIISLHVPLTHDGIDATCHMANKAFFNKMPVSSIFINTSRGEVVDSDAFLKAVQEEKFKASVLDVFEHEPDVQVNRFKDVSLITPHIAGYSLRGKINATLQALMNMNGMLDLGMEEKLPLKLNYPSVRAIELDQDMENPLPGLMKRVYDITADDRMLRNSNNDFESLRKNYVLRQQFSDFIISRGVKESKPFEIIKAMGFNVL